MSQVDPVIVAALITGVLAIGPAIAALVVGILGRRDNTSRAELHARVVDGQNQLIGRLQADQVRNDGRIDELSRELRSEQARVDALEKSANSDAARIVELTQWGTWSNDEPPRTPPPWTRDN